MRDNNKKIFKDLYTGGNNQLLSLNGEYVL